jgi:hypothetical protein
MLWLYYGQRMHLNQRHPHMVDMEVIARLQDRGAQRLDHLLDQALCGPKGAGDRRSPT